MQQLLYYWQKRLVSMSESLGVGCSFLATATDSAVVPCELKL